MPLSRVSQLKSNIGVAWRAPQVSAEASAAGDFCIKNGGELIVRKDGNGVDYTVCKLPDGTMIDAEEFYKTGGDLSKFKSVNR